MSSPLSPRERLIVPLDVPDADQARALVEAVAPHAGVVKIGLQLFIAEGPSLVREIAERGGCDVFLDLKLHDIPATVERAVRSVRELGAKMLTVHADLGGNALEAAAHAARDALDILCVTVLTSIDDEAVRSSGFGRDARSLVLDRAEMALACGCAGVICSPLEVAAVRERTGGRLRIVTPGIRPAWAATRGDQVRVATPRDAIVAGADRIVVGRPIRNADDPAAAAARIVKEIEEAGAAAGTDTDR